MIGSAQLNNSALVRVLHWQKRDDWPFCPVKYPSQWTNWSLSITSRGGFAILFNCTDLDKFVFPILRPYQVYMENLINVPKESFSQPPNLKEHHQVMLPASPTASSINQCEPQRTEAAGSEIKRRNPEKVIGADLTSGRGCLSPGTPTGQKWFVIKSEKSSMQFLGRELVNTPNCVVTFAAFYWDTAVTAACCYLVISSGWSSISKAGIDEILLHQFQFLQHTYCNAWCVLGRLLSISSVLAAKKLLKPPA